MEIIMNIVKLITVLTIAVSVECKPYDHKRSHVAVKSFRDDPPYPYAHRHKRPSERWMSWSPVNPEEENQGRSTLGAAVQQAIEPPHPQTDSHALDPETNYTEKPAVEDICKDVTCHLGRVCSVQNGLAICICGPPDLCDDKAHRVCGSDGLWYPSHCELHRRACVETRHIGIDHTDSCVKTDIKLDGAKSRSERISTGLIEVGEIEIENGAVESNQSLSHNDSIETTSAQYDDLYDYGNNWGDMECTELEYERLKSALLQYHCVRLGETGCQQDPTHKQFVASIMFNYYDANEDESLNFDELLDISERDHLSKLSQLCQLTDLLQFSDLDDNQAISLQEFYTAFDIPTVILSEDLRTFTTIVTVGNSVELKCDVKGSHDLIWKRNGAILENLTTNKIKTFDDGSLYIGNLGIHHMANYTCQDRRNDDVVQTHVLYVRMPPLVSVSPATQFHTSNSEVTLKCHTQSIPDAVIQWQINEVDIPDSSMHYIREHDNTTLTIKSAEYTRDTGAYKCKATNSAGVGQDIATVFIENDRVPKYGSEEHLYEVFVVFHDKGYTLYEPIHCHIKHTVSASYTNFKYVPESVNMPQTLCKESESCVWGDAVNVNNRFIYVTQPTMNRVVVIEIEDRSNPLEIINMDRTPVSIQYVEGLDQVYILCWNGDDAEGVEKTTVIIRQASVNTLHTIVHTPPIDNQVDKVADHFIPPNNDLKFQFDHGYVIHDKRASMYKLQLNTQQYVKNIDLANYHCQPKRLVYIPIGGQLIIQCEPLDSVVSDHAQLLVMDVITDTVRYVIDSTAIPHVSPDSRYVILEDPQNNLIQVYYVTDTGVLEKRYDTYTNLHVSGVKFFPSEHGRGYDLYLTSKDHGSIAYINLNTGKLNTIEGVGEPIHASEWRWSDNNRVLVSGGVFSQYLVTPSQDALVILDGRRREVQCQWQDVTHANVIVWVKPRSLT